MPSCAATSALGTTRAGSAVPMPIIEAPERTSGAATRSRATTGSEVSGIGGLPGDVEGAALQLLAEGATAEAGEDVAGAGLEEGLGAGSVHRGERVAPAHLLGQ